MPRINPEAPETGMIVGEFDGLKNTINPERMGEKDLVRAINIDLDDAGQISRRRGFIKKVCGNAHSPFQTFQGITLLVLDGALGILNPDYSFTSLQTGIGSDPAKGTPPLAYAQVGDTVYYSGVANSGKIDLDAKTVSAWGTGEDLWLSPVVNPTATLPAVAGRLLGPPPLATTLAYFNGRIYMGVGSTLWATVLYTYDYVDKTAGFKQFEAPITMIGAVGDGVYVGTTEGLWFLTGPQYSEMKRTRVMDSPVIPGSMVIIPAELGNPPQISRQADEPVQVALAFLTNNGFCVAQDGGQTYNLTESKLFMPNSASAAAMYRRMDGVNQYITTMQNADPASAAGKIGDYVDATIIRGAKRGGWVIVPPDCNQIGDALSPSWPPSGGGTVSVHDALAPTWVPHT